MEYTKPDGGSKMQNAVNMIQDGTEIVGAMSRDALAREIGAVNLEIAGLEEEIKAKRDWVVACRSRLES
jgi:hypothetical protein